MKRRKPGSVNGLATQVCEVKGVATAWAADIVPAYDRKWAALGGWQCAPMAPPTRQPWGRQQLNVAAKGTDAGSNFRGRVSSSASAAGEEGPTPLPAAAAAAATAASSATRAKSQPGWWQQELDAGEPVQPRVQRMALHSSGKYGGRYQVCINPPAAARAAGAPARVQEYFPLTEHGAWRLAHDAAEARCLELCRQYGIVAKDKTGAALAPSSPADPAVAARKPECGPPRQTGKPRGRRQAVPVADQVVLPQLQCISVRKRCYMLQCIAPPGAGAKGGTKIRDTFGVAKHGTWAAAYKAAEARLRS
jgi:hypothetical protein